MVRTRDSWKLIAAVTVAGGAKKSLLYGPPGTGKTTAACRVGDPSEVYKVTLHEEMSAAELIGHFIPDGQEFKWHDGIAIKAWKNGARLVLDEIDRASGDVLTILYAVLDDPDVARLTLATGQTVKPQEGFTCIATMNGHPNDLPDALRDRFEVVIQVPDPHPGAIEALPQDLQVAARNTVNQTDPARSATMRQWQSFGKLRAAVGEEDAAQAVFGKRAEEVLDGLRIASA